MAWKTRVDAAEDVLDAAVLAAAVDTAAWTQAKATMEGTGGVGQSNGSDGWLQLARAAEAAVTAYRGVADDFSTGTTDTSCTGGEVVGPAPADEAACKTACQALGSWSWDAAVGAGTGGGASQTYNGAAAATDCYGYQWDQTGGSCTLWHDALPAEVSPQGGQSGVTCGKRQRSESALGPAMETAWALAAGAHGSQVVAGAAHTALLAQGVIVQAARDALLRVTAERDQAALAQVGGTSFDAAAAVTGAEAATLAKTQAKDGTAVQTAQFLTTLQADQAAELLTTQAQAAAQALQDSSRLETSGQLAVWDLA